MNGCARASLLLLAMVAVGIGHPITAGCAQVGESTVPSVPNFEDLPDMPRLLAEGTGIADTTLSGLGYAKVSQEEYEKLFSSPSGVAHVDSTIMFVAVNVLMILQTGTVVEAGAEAVITIDGDRYMVSTTPSAAATPSVWRIGDNGMTEQVAPSGGVPGALTKMKYRSAEIDYDLYFYHGVGKTFLERILRKSAKDGPGTWTVAVEQDGVHYVKSVATDAKAAGAVGTPPVQK